MLELVIDHNNKTAGRLPFFRHSKMYAYGKNNSKSAASLADCFAISIAGWLAEELSCLSMWFQSDHQEVLSLFSAPSWTDRQRINASDKQIVNAYLICILVARQERYFPVFAVRDLACTPLTLLREHVFCRRKNSFLKVLASAIEIGS